MTRKSFTSLLAVALCFLATVPVWAGNEGRLVGSIIDPNGDPIVDVQIVVTGLGFDVRQERTTNKKGKFTLLILDATKDYLLHFEKDGYQTVEEPLRLPLGDTVRREWTMVPGTSAPSSRGSAASQPAAAAPSGAVVRGQAGKLYEKGAEAYATGDLEVAADSFEQVVALEPDLAEVHAALAMTYLRQEQWEKAASSAQNALDINPDEVLNYEIQYDAYRSLGDLENQYRVLEVLVAKSPGPDTARRVFNRGVGRTEARDLEGAAVDFETAKTMAPELVASYSALTRVYFDMGRYEDSVANGRQALEIDPNHYETMGVLFLALRAQGQTEEADAMFANLEEGNPQFINGVLMDLGVSYFNNGDAEQAQGIFERVVGAQPENGRAHYMLGLCYLGKGETAKAKELLERFLELEPNDPEAATAREMLSTL
ncbi:MAG: tetratricopeptide repeat protein [Nitrospirae bacterium]|nr:tetratricopeptide repeat protein [Nitrospirota bacterium]